VVARAVLAEPEHLTALAAEKAAAKAPTHGPLYGWCNAPQSPIQHTICTFSGVDSQAVGPRSCRTWSVSGSRVTVWMSRSSDAVADCR
jgi:hypothetical protein